MTFGLRMLAGPRPATRAILRRRGAPAPVLPVRITAVTGAVPPVIAALGRRRLYLVAASYQFEFWGRRGRLAGFDLARLLRVIDLDHDPEHYRAVPYRSIVLMTADWTLTLRVRHRMEPAAMVRALNGGLGSRSVPPTPLNG
jgi:hypothetical protein